MLQRKLLKDLVDKDHWRLHLKAVVRDTPSLKAVVDKYLSSVDSLPDISHPADIHDWLEKPETRLEVSNG